MALFLPSESGFAFTNSWPSTPVLDVRTPLGRVRIGDASGGLCGGMVFAALDFWYASRPAPGQRPSKGDPLYTFIVRRLIDSWHLPTGPARYFRWMRLTDDGRRGVSVLTIERELPRIIRALDRGRPVPLGIVAAASSRLGDLARNHQVLAYACDVSDDQVTLRVYDPNCGPRDDVAITFAARTPAGRTDFEHSLDLADPVRGFFAIRYRAAKPPVDGRTG